MLDDNALDHPLRAPIKQSSSMITGPACKGSSTPPIPTPPDR